MDGETKTFIEELMIQNTLNTVEIKQLTFLTFELLHRLEQKDDVTNLKIEYANTLMREKANALDQLRGAVPVQKIVSEKFQVHSLYQSLIAQLQGLN